MPNLFNSWNKKKVNIKENTKMNWRKNKKRLTKKRIRK